MLIDTFLLNGSSPGRLERDQLGYHFLSQSWRCSPGPPDRIWVFPKSARHWRAASWSEQMSKFACSVLILTRGALKEGLQLRAWSTLPSLHKDWLQSRGLWTPMPGLSLPPHSLPSPCSHSGGYFTGPQSPLSSIIAKSFESEPLFSSSLNVLYQPLTLELINV